MMLLRRRTTTTESEPAPRRLMRIEPRPLTGTQIQFTMPVARPQRAAKVTPTAVSRRQPILSMMGGRRIRTVTPQAPVAPVVPVPGDVSTQFDFSITTQKSKMGMGMGRKKKGPLPPSTAILPPEQVEAQSDILPSPASGSEEMSSVGTEVVEAGIGEGLLSSIPTWGWIAIAGAALLMLGGKGKRKGE